ncbi:MAG: AAA family ATPase, partial [Anaerolineae bacterium]
SGRGFESHPLRHLKAKSGPEAEALRLRVWRGSEVRLKRAVIRNFKNLSDVTIDFHPHATALIGKNNSGKSSVLQALDVLLAFFGQRPLGSWKRLHSVFVTGQQVDLAIDIEADVDFDDRELGPIFGDNLSPLISSGSVTPFLYLTIGKDLDFGIGFRAAGTSKRFKTQPPSGSFSSGIDEVLAAAGVEAIGQINVNMGPISAGLVRPALLSSDRLSEGVRPATGAEQLQGDASNLMEFLLTLLSRNREGYQMIVRQLQSMMPEVTDFTTPLEDGRQVHGQIRDRAHASVVIDWDQVSAGTKHLLQILAFASSTPLVLIEEPELSLHSDATVQLIKTVESICKTSGKQLICTTHSPALIDALRLDQIRVVERPPNGVSTVKDMGNFKKIENKIRKFGLSLGPLLSASGPSDSYPRFVLVVEGHDDVKIWEKLLEHGKVDNAAVRIVKGEGWQDACAITRYVGFLRRIGVHSLNYLLVLDSDGDQEKRDQEVRSLGLNSNEFIVLSQKELESYLLDPAALAGVTGRQPKEVSAVIKAAKGQGKERLGSVLRELGITSTDTGIMQAIVQHMTELPEELAAIIDRVKAGIKS